MAFFKQAPVAFACYQSILDEWGQPCDCTYAMVNPAFERLTGLLEENILNKRFSEIPPLNNCTGSCKPDIWNEAFTKTLAGKEGIQLDVHYDSVGKWVRASVFRIAEDSFACTYEDVTAERQLSAERRITERESVIYQKALEDKSQLIEMIMDNVPVGIWMTDKGSHSIFMNKYARDNFNLSEEEKEICRMTDQNVINKGVPLHHEEVVTFKDDKKHILETVKTKILPHDGSDPVILGTGLDITDRKKAEEHLRISERKYRFLTENTSDVIWVISAKDYKYTYISPSVLQLRGYTPEEAMDQSIEESLTPESLAVLNKELPKRIKAFMKDPVQSNAIIIDLEQPCKSGETVWIEMSAKLQYNENRELEVIGVSRNIDGRKKTEKKVLYLSYHDQLTGLYNRRFYEEEMRRINTQRNHPITLVMADLDDLKRANDTYGHSVGDELLKDFAEVLKEECRCDDIIARIGGDEFIILLPKSDYSEGERIVKRINGEISKRCNNRIPLSVSFGWETKYKKEESFDAIFKQAEDMMYQHKNFRVSSVR